MHPDPSPDSGSAVAPALKKRRPRRWIVRLALALFVAVALSAAAAAWLVPDPAGYAPWRSLPGDCTLAIDIRHPEAVLARLVEDRVFDAASGASAETPDAARFREPLDALRGYLSIPPAARRFFHPRQMIAVFSDSRPPVVLLALPRAARVFLALYSRFSATLRFSDSDTWHFTVRDGWLVASASEEALFNAMSAWGKSGGPFGEESHLEGEYVALAFRRAEPAARHVEENAFLIADPFADSANAAPASPGIFEDGKLVRVVATPDSEGWAIRGVRGAGDASRESATPEPVDFGAAPPHGHVRLLVDMGPEQRRLVERIASEPRFRRGHPWIELGKLWLDKGWLAHAGGRFSALASADPDADLPSLRLKWDVPGEGATAAGDFAETFGLWMRSLSAPGGQPLAQSLRSALDYVEYADDEGRGGVLSPPGGLFSGLNLEWKFAGGPGRSVGEMALANRGTGIGGETPHFEAWREGGDDEALFAVAAEWNATPAMFDNGVEGWRLIAPLLFGKTDRAAIDARLKLARLFAACYPAGALTASREGDILRFHIAIRSRRDA